MPAFVMPSDRDVLSAMTRLVRAVDDPLDRQILAPLVMQELLYRLLRSDAAAAVRSAVAREAANLVRRRLRVGETGQLAESIEGRVNGAAPEGGA